MPRFTNRFEHDVLPLRAVAGSTLTISEVSSLSGISKSTLSRLWDSQRWVKGNHYATISRLGVVLPGVAEYARWVMHTERLSEVIGAVEQAGMEVDIGAVERAADQVPPVQLALVLDAAGAFARGDSRSAFRRLDLCWGSLTDASVSRVFEADIIRNKSLLLERVASSLAENPICQFGQPDIGRSIATHKLVKAGLEPPAIRPIRGSKDNPFDFRSRTIGTILSDNDYDLVGAYSRKIELEPHMQLNELWSLATYSADIPTRTDPRALPRRASLCRTSKELLYDLSTGGGAYACYLTSTAIPTVLSFDSTFAGHGKQLGVVLNESIARAEQTGDRVLLAAAGKLRTAWRSR